MEVQIESITSTPSHLRISMVVRGPKNSWVRFCEAIVPMRDVPILVVRDLLNAGRLGDGLDDQPDDDTPLPGLEERQLGLHSPGQSAGDSSVTS